MKTQVKKAYRYAAERLFAQEGKLEIDDNALVSYTREGEGAYVAAWVWVPKEEIAGKRLTINGEAHNFDCAVFYCAVSSITGKPCNCGYAKGVRQ